MERPSRLPRVLIAVGATLLAAAGTSAHAETNEIHDRGVVAPERHTAARRPAVVVLRPMRSLLASMPQLYSEVQFGYQSAPSFEALEGYFELEGQLAVDLQLGARLSRWVALYGYCGFGALRLRDRHERPRNDITTLRVGAGLRLTWPLSRYIRPFAELRAGGLWLGEADEGPGSHPQKLSLPRGFELAYGAGIEVSPLGVSLFTISLRVMHHRMVLEGPRGMVEGREPVSHRASSLSLGAGVGISIPLGLY